MSHYIPTKMGIIGVMRGLANDVANVCVTTNAMDNSPPCFPQRGEKGIYNSESAEDVDFEFAPDSVKRQYLQRAGKHRAFCVQAGRSPVTRLWQMPIYTAMRQQRASSRRNVAGCVVR